MNIRVYICGKLRYSYKESSELKTFLKHLLVKCCPLLVKCLLNLAECAFLFFCFFTKITFEGKNRECYIFSKFILLFENSPLNYNARFNFFNLDYEMAE